MPALPGMAPWIQPANETGEYLKGAQLGASFAAQQQEAAAQQQRIAIAQKQLEQQAHQEQMSLQIRQQMAAQKFQVDQQKAEISKQYHQMVAKQKQDELAQKKAQFEAATKQAALQFQEKQAYLQDVAQTKDYIGAASRHPGAFPKGIPSEFMKPPAQAKAPPMDPWRKAMVATYTKDMEELNKQANMEPDPDKKAEYNLQAQKASQRLANILGQGGPTSAPAGQTTSTAEISYVKGPDGKLVRQSQASKAPASEQDWSGGSGNFGDAIPKPTAALPSTSPISAASPPAPQAAMPADQGQGVFKPDPDWNAIAKQRAASESQFGQKYLIDPIKKFASLFTDEGLSEEDQRAIAEANQRRDMELRGRDFSD